MTEILVSALLWVAVAFLVREFLWPVLMGRRGTAPEGTAVEVAGPAESIQANALKEARAAVENLENAGRGDTPKCQAWRKRIEALEG